MVGRQVVMTSGCIIGAACSVTGTEELEENCVIYGANCERRSQKERPPVCHILYVVVIFCSFEKSAIIEHKWARLVYIDSIYQHLLYSY